MTICFNHMMRWNREWKNEKNQFFLHSMRMKEITNHHPQYHIVFDDISSIISNIFHTYNIECDTFGELHSSSTEKFMNFNTVFISFIIFYFRHKPTEYISCLHLLYGLAELQALQRPWCCDENENSIQKPKEKKSSFGFSLSSQSIWCKLKNFLKWQWHICVMWNSETDASNEKERKTKITTTIKCHWIFSTSQKNLHCVYMRNNRCKLIHHLTRINIL